MQRREFGVCEVAATPPPYGALKHEPQTANARGYLVAATPTPYGALKPVMSGIDEAIS